MLLRQVYVFSMSWAPFKCHATSLAQVLMGLPVMFEIYWSGNTFAILQIQTFITLSLLSFHLLSEIPVLTAMRKNVFNYDETVWSFGGGQWLLQKVCGIFADHRVTLNCEIELIWKVIFGKFAIYKELQWLLHNAETATSGVLWEKGFFKISQNSQESTCAWVSF